jgi:hypothetical protein
MKIGFTGTQDGITPPQFDLLVEVLQELHEVTEAHHGDCIGADREFSVIVDCIFGTGKIHVHPPTDNKKRAFVRSDTIYNPFPFLVRNKNIVNATDILIACPKGMNEEVRSGTWATIRYARKQKGVIVILWPDGKYTYEEHKIPVYPIEDVDED